MSARTLALAVLALHGLAFPIDGLACADLVVTEARVREPPPGAAAAAAYFRIVNKGSRVETVDEVRSACCDRVFMHRSVHRDNQVHMSHVDGVTLNPNEELVFEPGGMHLMLMLSADKPEAGETIEMSFACETGAALSVDFSVVKMQ